MASKTNTDPLLSTKLHRPPVADNHVHRQHLLDRLNQHRERPLTLISAPAGYGKTVLASCWLEACDSPGGWLSLDENDNDLRMFTAYFIAAVESLFHGACLNTQALLSGSDLPPMVNFASKLLNELDRIEQPYIIVLDDYYLIQETMVHDLLAAILKHPPQFLHLVIVARQDPPLAISKLRAQSLLTEIRTQDLRFTLEETEVFLTRVLGTHVDLATAAVLEKKTEGWVTGLRLVALSMRHRGGLDRKLLEPQVDVQYVMEYLFTEVFSQQPPEISQCLLYIAILNRFCGPLCEAVCVSGAEAFTCEASGWEFIAWLKKENMFLIPLDTENRWFRFHHLFQKLLFNQLKRHNSPEDIDILHTRASQWFAENGLVEEAIRHALAAGDEIGAAELVEQNRQVMLNSDRWYILGQWLSMLPDAVIQKRPELLLARSWVYYFEYKHALIPPSLDAAESLLGKKTKEQPLYGEIYLFKAVACFFQGNGALSLKYIEEALDRIPLTYHMIRGFAEIYFGFAGQMQGQKERVVRELSDLLTRQSLNDLRKVRVLAALVWVNTISGDLIVASRLNQQLRNVAIGINSATFIAYGSYIQGLIHFYRNELDIATHYLSQAADLCYVMLRRGGVDDLAGLTLVYQAVQQPDKATATLERLFEYIHSLNDPALLDIANSCSARLSLMKGEVTNGSAMPGMDQKLNGDAMFLWLEVPVITQCRVLLAEGSDASLLEAEKKLQECLRLSKAQHNTFQMIGIMALQASVIQKQGRTDEALVVLEAAIDLARSGEFIRPFVELGATMEYLLKRLAEKNIALDYIGQLLAAFREYQHGGKHGVIGTETVGRPSLSNQSLVDPLTNRELEILELLAQRLSNKEIAAKLFISHGTVKTHLNNIYRKLTVTGRLEAVEKAYTLNILIRR